MLYDFSRSAALAAYTLHVQDIIERKGLDRTLSTRDREDIEQGFIKAIRLDVVASLIIADRTTQGNDA